MKIPKTIKLLDEVYKIKLVESIESNKGSYVLGTHDSSNNTICIRTKDLNGKSIPNKELQITLIHELMHAVCRTGCYFDINNDEPFIEWCARNLNRIIPQLND